MSVWDAFVWEYGHFLQSRGWGDFKSRFGWSAERVTIERSGKVVAGAQVLFRRGPLGLTLAYIPRGPVLARRDEDVLAEWVEAVDAIARGRRAIFLKVEPDWEDTPTAHDLLHTLGFVPSPQTVQPRSTIVVDLAPSPEEILARMKSKWRYNIRLARRKQVVVRPVRTEEEFAHFLRMMRETARRDGFPVHTDAYYREAWRSFADEDRGVLLMAWYEALPLAAIFVVRWNRTAIYLYGASSNRERNRMPNHLLQWHAMLWAKERGATHYDLWGIPDEVGAQPDVWAGRTPKRTDGLWGVFRFKQGFGGRIVRTVGAWDRVYNRPLYALYSWWIRRRRRGLS